MQQFSKEKNIPIRSFIGDETKNASGLNGPGAIADDIDTIINMFDPESSINVINEDGTVTQIPGGLDEKNLKPRLLGKIEQAYEFTKKDRFFGLIINDDIIVNTTVSFAGIYAEYSAGKDVQCSVLREAEHCESISRITGIRFLDIESEIIVPCSFRFDFGFPDGRSYVLIVSDPNYSEQEIVFANTTVYEWAMQPNKPTYTASEVGAYTKDETEKLVEKIAGSTESILYEDVVNTPEWSNQPTIEGALDTAFNTDEFYYVTLKDEDGNALQSGKFLLKNSYGEDATVYSTLFSLSSLDTGFGTLTENYPVEFVSIETNFALRDAGITLYEQEPDSGDISHGTGSIRMVVQGEVIPRNANLYCYSHFKTDKYVSSYHSTNGTTAFQNDSSKDIVAYTAMAEINNIGNKLYDNILLKKAGSGHFSIERNVIIRYNENYKNSKLYQVFGFGHILSDDTNITSIAFRFNNANNGMFRNGTKIIVSVVK